jgi:methionyl-tRNA formyltransferase
MLRIIFMGTPDFAVASLDALLLAGCNVVAVVTAPDKPAGRGLKLTASAVKQFATEKGLPVLQPEKLKSPEFLEALRSYKADLQIVVAFRMLPEIVWSMPPMGTLNLHGSLLPQYRGAAPIHWAVINVEKESCVTTFRLKNEIDTGDILLQKKFPIGDDETTGEVHDRMKVIGAELLVETVKGLESGQLKERPQSLMTDGIVLKHAPKIFTENCQIDWNKSAEQIHNLVRGLSPFPGALTTLDGRILKVFRSAKELSGQLHPPGQMLTDGKTFLKFACADGFIHVLDLQLEGKKRMLIEDFLRGYKTASA